MSLDYHWRCPIIDKNISTIKDKFDDFIDDKIIELSPLISDVTRDELRKEWTEELYQMIESEIEELRDSNRDLRHHAEKVIENLEAEKSELESKIEELENVIDDLENIGVINYLSNQL